MQKPILSSVVSHVLKQIADPQSVAAPDYLNVNFSPTVVLVAMLKSVKPRAFILHNYLEKHKVPPTELLRKLESLLQKEKDILVPLVDNAVSHTGRATQISTLHAIIRSDGAAGRLLRNEYNLNANVLETVDRVEAKEKNVQAFDDKIVSRFRGAIIAAGKAHPELRSVSVCFDYRHGLNRVAIPGLWLTAEGKSVTDPEVLFAGINQTMVCAATQMQRISEVVGASAKMVADLEARKADLEKKLAELYAHKRRLEEEINVLDTRDVRRAENPQN